MDWAQFSIMIVAFVGLFFWNRTESRTDIRHTEALLASQRDLVDAIRKDGEHFRIAMMKDGEQFRFAMMQETKEFHQRLCEIESKK